MMLLKNKWFWTAFIWFLLGIYTLLFREQNTHAAPPFPHFDKVLHLCLFFAQTWLNAKIWMSQSRRVPYWGLGIFGLCYALSSEWAQHFFTQTRNGDFYDVVADLMGVLLALKWANIRTKLAQINPSSNAFHENNT